MGSTTDLELRLYQDNEGWGALHTRYRRPVVLVWHKEFDRVDDAFAREKQVQNWSRVKREALIRRDYEALPLLAEPTKRRRRRGSGAGEGG